MTTLENSMRVLLDSAYNLITDTDWRKKYEDLILRLPININATDEAKNLLTYLYSIQGKALLSGQHEYLEAPYTYCNWIYGKTGVYPTIKGIELGGISGQSEYQLYNQRVSAMNAGIQWVKDGGITIATYHQEFPGGPYTWDTSVKYVPTPQELADIVTPGTNLYNEYLESIDKVAVILKLAKDENIPVLWRPFHEMNGAWFWWGGNASIFKQLWDIMYDRLTNYHELNNLLWVWSPNADNQWSGKSTNFFVGVDKCDALAMDIYDADYKAEYHQTLWNLGKGKIMAIGENGQLPNPTRFRQKQHQYSWFMTWGKYINENVGAASRINSDATIISVYSDPYVLNRNEVYDPYAAVYPIDTSVGDGLYGNYYIGQNFETWKLGKVVPTVNFNWTTSTTVGNWNTSVKWAGYIRPRYTEEYTIYTEASDGVELYLDGKLIIDDWVFHSKTEKSAKVVLEADKYYYIELLYYNAGDTEANVKLSWSSESQVKEIIPQARLYTF